MSLPLIVHVADCHLADAQFEAQNISLDGAYVTSAQSLEVGQQFDLELQFAKSAEVIRCRARVMRCEKLGERFGIGLSFRQDLSDLLGLPRNRS